MKPGLLINDLRTGGAERLVVDLAVELQTRDNIHPAVIVANRRGELLSMLESSGVPVYSLDVDISTMTIPKAVQALSELLADRNIELVHSHLSFSHVVGRLACGRLDIPHISTFHNVRDQRARRKLLAERTTRSLSDRIVCVSGGVKQSYKNTDKMMVIYNGIDTDDFHQRVATAETSELSDQIAGKTVFVNVARCVEQKRQTDLIEAIDELSATDVHLFIVGEGPQRPVLEDLVSQKGLSDRVTVTGYVDRIEPYYAVADVFVSSSSREGLPSTHLEAKAAQLPIISTEIPGVTELVEHGVDGYLCPVGEPSEMAACMQTAHTTEIQTLGKRGFETVATDFSIDTIASEHADLYQSLI